MAIEVNTIRQLIQALTDAHVFPNPDQMQRTFIQTPSLIEHLQRVRALPLEELVMEYSIIAMAAAN